MHLGPLREWKIPDPNTYNTRQGRRDRKGEKVPFDRRKQTHTEEVLTEAYAKTSKNI